MPVNKNKKQRSENEAEQERILWTDVHKIHYTSTTGSPIPRNLGTISMKRCKQVRNFFSPESRRHPRTRVRIRPPGPPPRSWTSSWEGRACWAGAGVASAAPSAGPLCSAASHPSDWLRAKKGGYIIGRYTLLKNRSSYSTEYRIYGTRSRKPCYMPR